MIANPGGGRRAFVYAPRASQRYRRLFGVAITHNYYTNQNGQCSDFRIEPTAATRELMASLGLVLKNEGAGFSVFFPPDNLHAILAYLRREAQDPTGKGGFWSRLTFLMELVNPGFVSVTALPIQTVLADVNLYGCNLRAHGERTMAVLPEGEFMGAAALYPTISDEVTLVLPPQAHRITVSDISGAVALPPPNGDDLQIYEAGDVKYAAIDFSALPHDLYTINAFDAGGRAIEDGGFPATYAYVPSGTDSVGLLDMLLTQPTRRTRKGIYPIPPLFDGDPDPADCGEVDYRLPFDARHTYWQYYVISQAPGRLTDLKIEGSGAKFKRQPDPVPLPDGSLATLFTTGTALPLRQKSPLRFELSGMRRDPNGNDNAIRAVRLPVAPAAPVWPGPDRKPTTGTSEMFVYV